MSEESNTPKKNILYWMDSLVKTFIPNFNIRAILYLSVIFALAMFVQIWRISAPPPAAKPPVAAKETVIADGAYWSSNEYKDKLAHQTVDSFTHELAQWLNGDNQEFAKRQFEDMLFINGALTPDTGGDLTTLVPESFTYLENNARARYRYARDKGFLNTAPTLVKFGTVVCAIDATTKKVTGIELYDWRYASMPKLAAFMGTKPDWKVQVGDRIFDVSDPRIEDKDLLRLRTVQTQPPGLFSFLIFRNPQTNRIVVADSAILDTNGVDAALTLSRIGSNGSKQSELYFRSGYEGCQQLGSTPNIPYGQSD